MDMEEGQIEIYIDISVGEAKPLAMVSKVEEATKRQHQQNQKGNNSNNNNNSKDWQSPVNLMIQCNKGKASKFKRSSSNLEEDGASSAILLLACIACTPSY
ncbi:hypothetical protein V6N12_043838 [Hibiscus sabdariffa]|uniref:Uncharacterized protein n=1 Tax=Hibiscus sabdariffa TaxID=183260 RepID=A0ABR2DFL3_9ROSI